MGIACINNHICDRICATDFRVSFDPWFSIQQLTLIHSRLFSFEKEINHFFFHSFYRTAYNSFYKVLLANAATSALRLHQRMPRISFTREYFSMLLVEDSCHYLFFSTIFLYVEPFILILLPVVLFAILHAASYSLTLLDVSWPLIIELWILNFSYDHYK